MASIFREKKPPPGIGSKADRLPRGSDYEVILVTAEQFASSKRSSKPVSHFIYTRQASIETQT
jgi:hypothetical protein